VLSEVPEIEGEVFWGGAGTEVWNGLHLLSADVYMHVITFNDDDEQALGNAKQVAVHVLENLSSE
jgi:hypothetical protein